MNIRTVSYVHMDDFGFDGDFLADACDHLNVSFGDAEYTLIMASDLVDAVISYNNCLVDDMLRIGVNADAFDKLYKLNNDVYVNIEPN